MRSVVALWLFITLCATANAAKCIAPNRTMAAYAGTSLLPFAPANALPPRRVSLFPAGLTKRRSAGWRTPPPVLA
jgi:hypothetical protein